MPDPPYEQVFSALMNQPDRQAAAIDLPPVGSPTYGYRYNSKDLKGQGFLGALQRPDGGVMSEFSIGVPIGGKEMEIPTLVPTLTKAEVQQLLSMNDGDKMPQSVVQKAIEYAKQRIAAGKSPFAGQGEQQSLYPEMQRQAVPRFLIPDGADALMNSRGQSRQPIEQALSILMGRQ